VATGLKLSEQSTEGEGEQQAQIVTTIKTYREVGGIKWPENMNMNAGGQQIIMKLKEVKLNKEVDATLFE
jgi:hypothetical protein